jgi:hypothetical protein
VRRFRVPLAALLVLTAAGCSRSGSDVTPVSGRVTVDGKPAAGAVVTFHPLTPTADAARPTARADEDGRFRLTTRAESDGAPPGEYRVTVAWREAAAAKRAAEGDELPAKTAVPDTHTRPESTPLRATVQPGANDPLAIDIKTGRR